MMVKKSNKKEILTRKRMIFIGILLTMITVVLFIDPVFSLKNPSAVYCEVMGYGYATHETAEGEVGTCTFSDGTSANAWDFLRGKDALAWSYCAKEGYEAKHVDKSEICEDCTVCVLANGAEVEVTELMGLNFEEGICGDNVCAIGESYINCPQDCPTGTENNYCDGIIDSICDPDCGTNDKDPDCICGNNRCDQTEDCGICPQDCGICRVEPTCGDKTCESGETQANCCADCGCPLGEKCINDVCTKADKCGNNICDSDENYKKCRKDCSSGSEDDYCDGVKDGVCDPDCSAKEDIDCGTKSGLVYYVIAIIFAVLILFIIYKKIQEKKKWDELERKYADKL